MGSHAGTHGRLCWYARTGTRPSERSQVLTGVGWPFRIKPTLHLCHAQRRSAVRTLAYPLWPHLMAYALWLMQYTAEIGCKNLFSVVALMELSLKGMLIKFQTFLVMSRASFKVSAGTTEAGIRCVRMWTGVVHVCICTCAHMCCVCARACACVCAVFHRTKQCHG